MQVITLEVKDHIQRSHDRLEGWGLMKNMKYRLRGEWIEWICGSLVIEQLDIDLQYVLTSQKAKHVLGCIQAAWPAGEEILHLCSAGTSSAMLCSQCRKDIILLE
ncbi:hypothetical protein DUI87_26420 [Hirundo rustica rustica]|uniref:Uncharacterized protein n=1 Tax=Hirundo rustica rustica TaxID=333673 RepID=A0A3M0JQP8_HIRRU|nr:hypothetical protein DUI87_26420 [Hirundo rustica rustica]